jgi:hypothetical protein
MIVAIDNSVFCLLGFISDDLTTSFCGQPAARHFTGILQTLYNENDLPRQRAKGLARLGRVGDAQAQDGPRREAVRVVGGEGRVGEEELYIYIYIYIYIGTQIYIHTYISGSWVARARSAKKELLGRG